MNEDNVIDYGLLTKWLRVLTCISGASLANSIIGFIPVVPASATTWISRAIMVLTVICMFKLSPVNGRYRKAWIMRAAMLACMLITTFLFASILLTLTASIFSIAAIYQEYNAHSELIADKDSRLADKWHGLFTWSIMAAVLVALGSAVTTLVVSMLEMEVVRLTAMIVGMLSVPQMILDLVYIMYMRKMINLFEEDVIN